MWRHQPSKGERQRQHNKKELERSSTNLHASSTFFSSKQFFFILIFSFRLKYFNNIMINFIVIMSYKIGWVVNIYLYAKACNFLANYRFICCIMMRPRYDLCLEAPRTLYITFLAKYIDILLQLMWSWITIQGT